MVLRILVAPSNPEVSREAGGVADRVEVGRPCAAPGAEINGVADRADDCSSPDDDREDEGRGWSVWTAFRASRGVTRGLRTSSATVHTTKRREDRVPAASRSDEPQRARAVFRKKLATAATAVLFVVGCGSANDADRPDETGGPGETTVASTVAKSGPPKGTKSFQNLSRDHVRKPVDYAQSPPVGGNHASIWQNCGFYSEPVRNDTAVHSMEHGAVWITYRPGLAAGQLNRLRGLASSETHVLVSPYPDLPNPVIASAWGKQLRLNSAQDPRLERFVRVFQQGPQTPEAGAPCTGGRSKAQPGYAGTHE